MRAIFYNNKINLISDFTYIKIEVICPRLNINKMLEQTGGKFISKERIILPYNHNAGAVYKVFIWASFSKVSKHLKVCDMWDFRKADNFDVYKEMLEINGTLGYTERIVLDSKIVGLYEFGSCTYYAKNNVHINYFNKRGTKVGRFRTENNDYGKKRYIKTGQGWLSNRGF